MELDFREVEFQNAAIGLKNATIGLKNATIGLKNTTIGLLEPGMRTYKIFLQENAAIGL